MKFGENFWDLFYATRFLKAKKFGCYKLQLTGARHLWFYATFSPQHPGLTNVVCTQLVRNLCHNSWGFCKLLKLGA